MRRIGVSAIEALGDALSQFVPVTSEITSIDLSPQLVSISSQSQIVLVLTYSLAIQGTELLGDISVVISLSTMTPLLEKLASHNADRTAGDGNTRVMDGVIRTIPLFVEARLEPTFLPASAIAGLKVGDVIVLDHRLTEPATVAVAGRSLFRGHIGRRGSRLALAVTDDPFPAGAGPGLLDGPQSEAEHGFDTDDGANPSDEAREQDARVPDTSTG
ncbi:MAG: FliM/FliN family flagellar motor switch protein [Ilumatobacteraceae bacterium]